MAAETSRTARRKKTAPNLEDLGQDLGKGNKPPQALDIEESVLGAMLIDPDCVNTALEGLSERCFYLPRNQKIFKAISNLVNDDHSPVDILTVSERLKLNGDLAEVGGAAVLAGYSEHLGSVAHIKFYVNILRQKAIQRDLIAAAYDILRDAFDDSVPVDELMDEAQSQVFAAIKDNASKAEQSIKDLISDVEDSMRKMQSMSGPSGVRSGFNSIDRITGGWQPSDLIILAARPSVGQTAFALHVARTAAVLYNMPVAFFSLEMSAVQLAKRLATSESGLSADKIKGTIKMEDYEWTQFYEKTKALTAAPLYIDDTPSLTIGQFRAKAKTLWHEKGIRLIVVDYLQLMQGPQSANSLREQEVAAISRMLKATAKELNIPIIALSQLSRAAVQRQGAGGKPQLSDLRESGSIEQDADMVIFIHRPDFVGLSENPEDRDKAQIIIAKHRNGETRDIDMVFKSERVQFMEVDDTLDLRAAGYKEYASSMNSDFDS